uniref:Uncharacterized protein n=1 Tax=Lactuca sativa TaxID=4236 RepID=A0A9R1XPA6_LACSA|nr:hypothetical protein LSAT_V11C200097160 [Lactuca sativa]
MWHDITYEAVVTTTCIPELGRGICGHLLNVTVDIGTHGIWIMETFPNSKIVGTATPGVVPRAIAYPRMRRLHTVDCERILDVRNLTPKEML